MVCERCEAEEARCHMTRITDAGVTQQHFCVACARALGFDIPAGPATDDPDRFDWQTLWVSESIDVPDSDDSRE